MRPVLGAVEDDELRFRSSPRQRVHDGRPDGGIRHPSRPLSAADLGSARSRAQLERFGRKTFREVIHAGAFSKSLSSGPTSSCTTSTTNTRSRSGARALGLRLTEGRMVRAQAAS